MANPDDTRAMLQLAHSFLRQKHENFGGLRAKTSFLENAFIAASAFVEVDQQQRAEVYHPDHLLFADLMAGDLNTGAQRIMENCQLMSEQSFLGICERFISYGASLNDPNMRQKAMLLYGVMAISRIQHKASAYVQPQQAAPQAQAAPQPAVQALPPPEEAPHRHEALFRPYMALGPKEGGERMAAEISRMDRTAATEFVRGFAEYAVTLRTTEKLRTAFALSNKIYWVFMQMRGGGNVIALPSPPRRG